jgi:hypothetical protein
LAVASLALAEAVNWWPFPKRMLDILSSRVLSREQLTQM